MRLARALFIPYPEPKKKIAGLDIELSKCPTIFLLPSSFTCICNNQPLEHYPPLVDI